MMEGDAVTEQWIRDAAKAAKAARDAKIVAALRHNGSMAAAARVAGVCPSTVARLCRRDESAAAARRFGRWRVKLRRAQRFARRVRAERRLAAELEGRLVTARVMLGRSFADLPMSQLRERDKEIDELMRLQRTQATIIRVRERERDRALGYIRAQRCA